MSLNLSTGKFYFRSFGIELSNICSLYGLAPSNSYYHICKYLGRYNFLQSFSDWLPIRIDVSTKSRISERFVEGFLFLKKPITFLISGKSANMNFFFKLLA